MHTRQNTKKNHIFKQINQNIIDNTGMFETKGMCVNQFQETLPEQTRNQMFGFETSQCRIVLLICLVGWSHERGNHERVYHGLSLSCLANMLPSQNSCHTRCSVWSCQAPASQKTTPREFFINFSAWSLQYLDLRFFFVSHSYLSLSLCVCHNFAQRKQSILADQMTQTAQIAIGICLQNSMKFFNWKHLDTTLIGSIQQVPVRDSVAQCRTAKVQHFIVDGLSYTARVAEGNTCQNVIHRRFLFCAEQRGKEIACFSLDGNETKTSEFGGNNAHACLDILNTSSGLCMRQAHICKCSHRNTIKHYNADSVTWITFTMKLYGATWPFQNIQPLRIGNANRKTMQTENEIG